MASDLNYRPTPSSETGSRSAGKKLKKLIALVFGVSGAVMLWHGGGFIRLGLLALIVGLRIHLRPDGKDGGDPAALADYENPRHDHPS